MSVEVTQDSLEKPEDAAPVPLETLRIVVAGDLGSGKSAVINSLLRKELMPRFFGQDWRPAVLIRYGVTQQLVYHTRDGKTVGVSDWSEIKDVRDVNLCEIVIDRPHMKGFEIVELPFFHDGRLLEDAVDFIAHSHVLIWVTISSQAWRLTEKESLEKLATAKKPQRILAVSRADKLRTEEHCGLIRDRLTKETDDYFSDIVFMHSNRDTIRKSESSKSDWERTRGALMFEKLERIRANCKEDEDETIVQLPSEDDIVVPMTHWKSVRSL
ncbi:hypothetical protein [Aliiroseovarius sp. 2305UL8-7]|uniref:hypothetical protein n=1 Tax=Aliiroseovarius conchicola TaxID=3121637 RepID=UPI003527FA61